MKTAVWAAPSPARALPVVAERAAAERRERDGNDGECSKRVPEDGEEPSRHEVEMLLRLRDACTRDGRRQGDGDGDPDRKPAVEEPDRGGPATAGEEERADAEQGRREEPSAEVVDAEGAVVPPRCRAPGKGPRGGRVGEERRRPGGQLRSAPGSKAREEISCQSKRKERSSECEQCLHTVS